MADYTASILEYFSDPEAASMQARDLADWLRVKKSQWNPFKASVEILVEAGKLKRSSNGLLSLRRAPVLLRGKIKRTSSGTGYFRPITESAPAEESVETPLNPLGIDLSDPSLLPPAVIPTLADDESIYVAPEDLNGAMTGDTVELSLSKRRRQGGQKTGRVTRILERARTVFVGVYYEQDQQGFVTVDGGVMEGPVSVGDPGAKGAHSGDKVVVEIVQFPADGQGGEGVLTRVLGPQGAPGVDCLSIIQEYQLPDEFPEEVLEAAREVVRQFNEHDLTDRVDLTGETIITIDPVDARDFDDAISLTEDEKGYWRLGVHIADVSHFVQEGSVLDRDAYTRGTSVYLPDRVLPMLPELISNGLASLQQGHVRFTKTAYIDFTPDGIPAGTEFVNSAIRVKQRFAYEQVMPILADPDAHREEVSDEILTLLERMHRLAMILRKRRFEKGALDLQLPEVKLDYSQQGRVAGAHQVAHDESHQLIEEFMLAANIAVATRLSQLGLPYLHRAHAFPDEKKLRALGDFVRGLGFNVKPWTGRQEIQKLLEAVRGIPSEQAISYAVLRSMKQAEYTPAEIGHFALAEDFYCHFTSPIRRYPDLVVHRLFGELARKGRHPKVPSVGQLAKWGEHCSETERRAEAAERDLVKIKLLTYLKDKIGYRQTAIVTGVERFGLFCLGTELPADGLIHVRNLPADTYEFDQKTLTLIGRRSGNVFRLGDRLDVEIARVDLHQRTLDYKLVKDTKQKSRSSKMDNTGPEPQRRRRPGFRNR